ncbi:MAG TPA: 30S ribosome-binding factor RbfA [Bacillota bacterium]|jgi:ribosome-binding factor A|nr:30S ribosome-binding factor RbfA [Bacillota bacterium]HOK71492.1 30S ribosome-binding factor RbfA [Bacillota bacterium]HOL51094.1 30S ribosome-binding factor RbfA [Bacillota bacterium]HOO29531.1 30S ribosome-binding factor RbfA [Bacillota bacterium]HPQ01858.1 30S ribosome-binding factor RbfA [Bacillota bacterium]
MSSYRPDRVKAAIRQEVSNILQRDLKDPRLGFATVTDVDISGDLQHVKIYVSILGEEESRTETMKALESAKGYIRSEIGRRVPLRLTPEISFEYDESIERGARILKLIEEVQSGRNDEESGDMPK